MPLIAAKLRIELQDLIRRLEREPREEDKKEMEKSRNLLLVEFDLIAAAHRRAVDINGAAAMELIEYDEEPYHFDDLDDEDVRLLPSEENVVPDEETITITPERRPILIPSTCLPKDNPLSKIELHLRKKQANRYLTALREVIAEKSFQYTHVIRVAPRKAVVTRARNIVIKLNHRIAFYCRMYGRCRAALLRLAPDGDTIKEFRTLSKQDVRASSAVVDPNVPGSTTLSLSWIWQITTAGEDSPASLRECM